ncbi:hypothetical protein [Flavobacterium sp. TAB 87]|uniref:hypothetical protein n=1 Tax=Flavobacterium sp. TAB 87 TaxID=1729581 RepID=UPI0012F9DC8D|nr:hypothetical protein [Flavobacterium sp. TAB 87]
MFIFVGVFIVSSLVLRTMIKFELSNDYFLYYNFEIFHQPSGFLSYLINEPYLFAVYSFFNCLLEDKTTVFSAMFWFNFLLSTAFFVWLIFRNDIEAWKKILLFVVHYFLFGYVLLRNGPSYILFAVFFHYTFRDQKFNWVLLTPFMHISSSLMLITYLHKWKHYFKMLLALPIIAFLFYLILKHFLSEIVAFDSIRSKVEIYSQGMPLIGFMHILFFLCIAGLVGLGFIIYKRKMLHPILVTTFIFYCVTFFINPIVAHRFSPYLLFALLLFPFDKIKNDKAVLTINRLSVLLFPMFVYFLYQTHRVATFEDFL